ncbi:MULTISPECIES: hypothetical protein [unclassified Lysinibacillus]|uniref:hypothetical protein n=1 Tax=unclassified Lysinibacillus TaxID=2636778 RepID=UPI002556639D|nr:MULTISPECIES: hypothetical protein [unclassified Lysinibacillus]MDM5247001.1 hypothetical protein [Lysinibacillus sp. G4S2]
MRKRSDSNSNRVFVCAKAKRQQQQMFSDAFILRSFTALQDLICNEKYNPPTFGDEPKKGFSTVLIRLENPFLFTSY